MAAPPFRINSIGFIGSGQLAERIARKLIQRVPSQHRFCYQKQRLVPTLLASDPSKERRQVFNGLGFSTTSTNNKVLTDCDLVFIATSAPDALKQLQKCEKLNARGKLFVELMGDLPAEEVENLICPGAKVIRMMPNNYLEAKGLPKGTLPPHSWAIIRGSNASQDDLDRVMQIAGISSIIDIAPKSFSATFKDGIAAEIMKALNELNGPVSSIEESCSHETKDFSELYALHDHLGRGYYSEVYLAREKESGIEYAVKCMNGDKLSEEAKETLMGEVAALNRLRHPSIIAHHGFYSEGDSYYLVLDYCKHGSLARLLKERGKLTEVEAKMVIRQLVAAVQYCHQMGHIHRDIKLENVLLHKRERSNGSLHDELEVKLADFGLSEEVELSSARLHEACGTPQYLSPEIVSGRTYSFPSDIWSLGILSYMLLSGEVPYGEVHGREQLDQLIRVGAIRFDLPVWQGISKEAVSFVQQMLDIDPAQRATAAQLLDHVWLRH